MLVLGINRGINVSDKKLMDFLVQRDGFKCQICGKDFGSFDRFRYLNYPRRRYGIHIDHVVSSSMVVFFYKLQWVIDEPGNKQILCIVCNVRKGSTDRKHLERMRMVRCVIQDFFDTKNFSSGYDVLERDSICCIKKYVTEKKITREEILRGFAYKQGRLKKIMDEDKKMLKELCDFINFDFKKI